MTSYPRITLNIGRCGGVLKPSLRSARQHVQRYRSRRSRLPLLGRSMATDWFDSYICDTVVTPGGGMTYPVVLKKNKHQRCTRRRSRCIQSYTSFAPRLTIVPFTFVAVGLLVRSVSSFFLGYFEPIHASSAQETQAARREKKLKLA